MVEYNVTLEGKTVLVTGAAGFIGNNLVKRLFHDVKDIKVIGIDSITDYYDVNIKYERLKEIEALNRDWTFVHASIADKEAVEKMFPGTKVAGVNTINMDGKNKRVRGTMTFGKTAKTKKAIVQLTEESAEIEIFQGL